MKAKKLFGMMKGRAASLAQLLLAVGAVLSLSACGGGSASTPPPPLGPPMISSLAPASAKAGAAGFTLTVNGTNFASGAVVQWNGSSRATTFVSSAQLTAAITSTDVGAPGFAAVSALNPGPAAFGSAPTNFEIDPANPTAVINSFSPPNVIAGGPGFTLEVSGTNFVSGAVVQWNGSSRPTSFVNTTNLSSAITAADIAKSGPVRITVLNPLAFVSDTSAFLVADPTPVLNSISPTSAIIGDQGVLLTASGSGFVSGSVILFGGAQTLPTTFVSSTQLTAAVPVPSASNVFYAGQYSIQVFNPNAPSPSESRSFELDNPKPTLTSLSPPRMTAGAAPFTLTINGSGFLDGASVQWNGSARPTHFVNGLQLTAAIPASDLSQQGSAQVSALNPAPSAGASASLAFTIDALTSNPLPNVSSLSDTSAPAGWPGFPLTVNGTGFVAASTAQWNGLNRPTTVLSSTLLKSGIPASDLATTGPAQVGVFNSSPGGGASNAVSFSIKSVAPGTVGVIERSSVATDLTEANADSSGAAISADGRFVAFASGADNLVPGDTNGSTDVFLRDTCLGAPAGCGPSVTRVSVASDGTQANGSSSDPAISGNGRYVAFSSSATNLVPGFASGNSKVYVRDTCFGAPAGCQPTTTVASSDVSADASLEPSLSADGRYVAFNNVVFGFCGYYSCDPNVFWAVVHDTCAGAPAGCNPSTVAASGTNSADPTTTSTHARISADGRYVAFELFANVFVSDTCTGAPAACMPSTVQVSVANDGSQANGSNFGSSISLNDRYVAFTSDATNLVDGDTNGFRDVFVRDTCLGGPTGCIPSTKRVSLANDGSQGNGNSSDGMVSADGRFVAFTSDATNLVAGDTSPFPKIFLRDTCLGVSTGCTPSTIRLSVALDGTAANNQSVSPMLNGNGRYVVFVSLASNLGPGDTNQVFDVFVARTNVP